MLTALDYLYRDAANYKAHGTALLTGALSPSEVAEIFAKLDSRTYFVPEQIGVPRLQSQLHALSNGPTGADHALHELLAIRAATDDEANSLTPITSAETFLTRVRAVAFWNPSLSDCASE